MGWTRPPCRDRRGGEDIPPLGATRLRFAIAGVALALGCALGAYAAVKAGKLYPVATMLAVPAVLFMALALFRWVALVGAALACLIAEYLLAEAAGSAATASVVAYAVGLVVLCELVFTAERLRGLDRVDVAVLTSWLRRLALVALSSAALALVVLAAATLRTTGSLALTVVGSAAAVVIVSLALAVGRGDRRH